MSDTAFPARPVDVVALTTSEFTVDLEWSNAPSLDEVCRRFGADANRAVVWLIRFRALQAWCTRDGMTQWLGSGGRTPRDICEAAAGFRLNDRWEFDAEAFCRAIDIIAARTGR